MDIQAIEQPSGEDTEQVDVEAAARAMGWRPLDEFSGDPSRHVDAQTFYKRGQEVMPILKAQTKTLLKRLDAAEKSAKQAAEYFSKAEERAYHRALADIRAEQEAAVESGDIEAHRKASDKLDKLGKLEKPGSSGSEMSEDQRAEDFADWGKANKWYATNSVMQAYADAQAQKIIRTRGGGVLDRADLDAVAEQVKAKFADDFPDEFGEKPRAKPRSAVEGVTPSRSRPGGKGFADLPVEAQRMADKWIKQGLIKTRDDYVKSYQW